MTSAAAGRSEAGSVPERRIVVMLGAPGAGKGTQAKRLSERLGLAHVSTGQLFREAVSDKSALGDQIRPYLASGSLVPDDVTIGVLIERIGRPDARAGAILDGFPRTPAQARSLDKILAAQGDAVTAALYVEVSPDELLLRLTGRRICTLDDQHVYHNVSRPPEKVGICDVDGAELIQREDDKAETVRSRLELQLPPMYEVIDYYAEAGVLSAVRGDQPVEAVTEDLLRALASVSRAS